ncbi:MAG: hypothetical protein WCH34_14950 [Bacteroidota bacterium]
MNEEKDFNFESALKEIENRRAEIVEKFDLKYGWSLEIIADDIQESLKKKYRITKETAEDATYEAISILLISIYEKMNFEIETVVELKDFLFAIAKKKTFNLIYKNTKLKLIGSYVNFEDANDTSIDFRDKNDSIEILLKNSYDGTKNIDAYLSEEIETLKLLDLYIIDNLSYKEIVAFAEYSHYKEATLRKKVERGLKKYRNFING